MKIYDSYKSLKGKTLSHGDMINFGLPGCYNYIVCLNFLENLTRNINGTFANDYIFTKLKVNKVDIAKQCYNKVEKEYKDEIYFPECETHFTNMQSLTKIALQLFLIKEGLIKDIWTD